MRGPPRRRPSRKAYISGTIERPSCTANAAPTSNQLPELARRLRALHEALVLWALDPYEPAPQPRFFCLHLPDFTSEQLEEWRRSR